MAAASGLVSTAGRERPCGFGFGKAASGESGVSAPCPEDTRFSIRIAGRHGFCLPPGGTQLSNCLVSLVSLTSLKAHLSSEPCAAGCSEATARRFEEQAPTFWSREGAIAITSRRKDRNALQVTEAWFW